MLPLPSTVILPCRRVALPCPSRAAAGNRLGVFFQELDRVRARGKHPAAIHLERDQFWDRFSFSNSSYTSTPSSVAKLRRVVVACQRDAGRLGLFRQSCSSRRLPSASRPRLSSRSDDGNAVLSARRRAHHVLHPRRVRIFNNLVQLRTQQAQCVVSAD